VKCMDMPPAVTASLHDPHLYIPSELDHHFA